MIEAPVLTQLKARFDRAGGVRRRAGVAARRARPAGRWCVCGQVARRRRKAPSWSLRRPQRRRRLHTRRGRRRRRPTPTRVALRQLWARQRIAQLGDEEALMRRPDAQREPITALGLQLQPAHALHQLHRGRPRGAHADAPPACRCDQPLPLPEGVSKLRSASGAADVGAVVPSTPEPRLAFALLLVALARHRRLRVATPRGDVR